MKLANAAVPVMAGIEETMYYPVLPREHRRGLGTTIRWSTSWERCGEERGRWQHCRTGWEVGADHLAYTSHFNKMHAKMA